jgi:hypothetical protein
MQWSPYALNGFLVLILLWAGYSLVERLNPLNQVLIFSTVLALPLTLTAVHDFRPDLAVALFTSVFAVALVRFACCEAPGASHFRSHFYIGMLVGAAYLAKPTFFPHTTVMCAAAFGLAEVCRRIFSSDRLQIKPTLLRLGGLTIGAAIVAGPYFLAAWKQILVYCPDRLVWLISRYLRFIDLMKLTKS